MNPGKRRSIGATGLHVARAIGDGFHCDVVQETKIRSQQLKVQMGLAKGILTCPHCRLAGHRFQCKTRKFFRSHLEDHKIMKALGQEREFIMQFPELVYSGYANSMHNGYQRAKQEQA